MPFIVKQHVPFPKLSDIVGEAPLAAWIVIALLVPDHDP
jgi:hypothetical protein